MSRNQRLLRDFRLALDSDFADLDLVDQVYRGASRGGDPDLLEAFINAPLVHPMIDQYLRQFNHEPAPDEHTPVNFIQSLGYDEYANAMHTANEAKDLQMPVEWVVNRPSKPTERFRLLVKHTILIDASSVWAMDDRMSLFYDENLDILLNNAEPEAQPSIFSSLRRICETYPNNLNFHLSQNSAPGGTLGYTVRSRVTSKTIAQCLDRMSGFWYMVGLFVLTITEDLDSVTEGSGRRGLANRLPSDPEALQAFFAEAIEHRDEEQAHIIASEMIRLGIEVPPSYLDEQYDEDEDDDEDDGY